MNNLYDKPKMRWVTFVILSIFAGMVIAASMNFLGVHDDDYLWHTVLSRDILKNGIPMLDTYSWRAIEMGYHETAHSWLGTIILGSTIDALSGLGMPPIFAGIIFSCFWYMVMMIVVWRMFFRKHIDYLFFLVCVMFALHYGGARMQNMSFLLILGLVYLLFHIKENAGKSRLCALLPLFTLLCANLHGGSIVLMIGIMIVFSVWMLIPDFTFGKLQHTRPVESKAAGAMMLWIGISILAAFINPYGPKLFTYFMHLSSNTFNSQYVNEWRPISVENFNFWIACVLLLIPIIRKQHTDILKYGILLGFTILAFKHQRFINYGIVLSLFLIKDYYMEYVLHMRKAAEVSDDKEPTESDKRYIRFFAGILILFALSVIFLLSLCFSQNMKMIAQNMSVEDHENVELDDNDPGEVITFALDRLAEGSTLSQEEVEYFELCDYQRPFCTYDLGSKLIYAGVPTFIDSRADLFENGELDDAGYLLYHKLPADKMDKIMEHYDFDAVIIESDYWFAFEGYLQNTRKWIVDYKDKYITVYKRVL